MAVVKSENLWLPSEELTSYLASMLFQTAANNLALGFVNRRKRGKKHLAVSINCSTSSPVYPVDPCADL